MGKAELGEKQLCPNCGSKFYDLTRRPAVCPKCGHAFDPADEVVRAKRVKTTRAPVYETEEDEEVEDKRAAKTEDEFEEETDAPEIDAEAEEEPADLVEDEEEGAVARTGGDALPPGFSETDEDSDIEPAADEDDDDGVPLLEEDEEFPDEEIGDVAEGEDDDNR